MPALPHPSEARPVNRTPLFDRHQQLGARMVAFAGWEMPVWYAGIQAEHAAVREAVGLFDVSHMGEFIVHGRDGQAVLRRALTNDVAALEIGEAQYTLLPNAHGGTVDDLLAYRLPDNPRGHPVYLLVVNASNIDKDRDWLRAQVRPGEDAVLDDRSGDMALVALQGPRAPAVLAAATRLDVWRMGYYRFDRGDVAGVPALVSRTGYTGEDGFEIMADNADIGAVWDALVAAGAAHGLQPAGLGARDSLRIEAAMPLYGHELDDDTSAIEAGLGRFVKLDKPEMVGRERLAREKAEGPARKMVCFEMTGRGIPRQGYAIHAGGAAAGSVTSGLQSPTLGRAIGMGYVPADRAGIGGELAVDIRGTLVPATIVRRPFYRRPDAG
ncbi:glycine cleavage system aminomethyltransferase GcvT [bacterium]|nr:MAG: glycine cleavage system aminomethyltransferase GcvT [bacterium]